VCSGACLHYTSHSVAAAANTRTCSGLRGTLVHYRSLARLKTFVEIFPL